MNRKHVYTLTIVLGAVFGAVVGALAGNVALWIGPGIAMAFVITTLLGYWRGPDPKA